jgi:2-polyprenyl-3-methyl-5-hydroxy-6-metoxy-1,4-benzoquinol methylase
MCPAATDWSMFKAMQVSCHVCAGGEAPFWFAKDGFEILRCRRCSSAWVHPTPDARLLEQYYRTSVASEAGDDALSVSVTQKSSRRRRRMIQRYVSSGVVLDIGCGKGYFLSEMRSHNFEVVGVELNRRDAEATRGRTGAEVIERPFLDAELSPCAFDVINLDQCLEHLPDPEAVLRRARQLLKPGGVLSVAVPNHSSIQSRVMGTRDPYIIPPEHVTFFTATGLRVLLTRAGFRVLDTATCGDLQGASILRGLERLSPRFLRTIISGLAGSPLERAATYAAMPVTAGLNLMKKGSIVEFYCAAEMR